MELGKQENNKVSGLGSLSDANFTIPHSNGNPISLRVTAQGYWEILMFGAWSRLGTHSSHPFDKEARAYEAGNLHPNSEAVLRDLHATITALATHDRFMGGINNEWKLSNFYHAISWPDFLRHATINGINSGLDTIKGHLSQLQANLASRGYATTFAAVRVERAAAEAAIAAQKAAAEAKLRAEKEAIEAAKQRELDLAIAKRARRAEPLLNDSIAKSSFALAKAIQNRYPNLVENWNPSQWDVIKDKNYAQFVDKYLQTYDKNDPANLDFFRNFANGIVQTLKNGVSFGVYSKVAGYLQEDEKAQLFSQSTLSQAANSAVPELTQEKEEPLKKTVESELIPQKQTILPVTTVILPVTTVAEPVEVIKVQESKTTTATETPNLTPQIEPTMYNKNELNSQLYNGTTDASIKSLLDQIKGIIAANPGLDFSSVWAADVNESWQAWATRQMQAAFNQGAPLSKSISWMFSSLNRALSNVKEWATTAPKEEPILGKGSNELINKSPVVQKPLPVQPGMPAAPTVNPTPIIPQPTANNASNAVATAAIAAQNMGSLLKYGVLGIAAFVGYNLLKK